MFLCTGKNSGREYSGWFVLIVGNFWSKKYLQNYCPLSVENWNLACELAVGACFAYVSHPVGGGGMLCIFSC